MSQGSPINFPLADQPERDNILISPGNQFILAGAGTGKSTIISQKIATLLTSGEIDSIDQVAAITFTRKAAGELRWKIEEKLEETIVLSGSSPDPLTRQNGDRAKAALKEIETASIGTIHTFCGDILKQYGLFAGLSPSFTLLEDSEEKIFLQNSIHEYLSERWSKLTRKNTGDPTSTDYLEQLMGFEEFQSIHTLESLLALGAQQSAFLEKIDPSQFQITTTKQMQDYAQQLLDTMLQKYRNYRSYYKNEGSNDLLGLKLDNFDQIINSSEKPDWQLLQKTAPLFTPSRERGSKKLVHDIIPVEDPSLYLAGLKIFLQYFGEKSGLYRSTADKYPSLLPLFTADPFPDTSLAGQTTMKQEYIRYLQHQIFLDFNKYYGEVKRNNSKIDYNDMIETTSKILDIPYVQQRISSSYRYLFIDEYQDTDPVQTAIFHKICSNTKNQKQRPTLVRVGDEKQSIYRFRGADIDTFFKEKELFEKTHAGKTSRLSVNMRSDPTIIEFVNSLFSSSPPGPLSIPEYSPLSAGKSFKEYSPGVYFTTIGTQNQGQIDTQYENADGIIPPQKTGIDHLRKLEAEYICAEIKTVLDQYPDAQIAVLFPTSTVLTTYMKPLEREKLPYKLFGRRYYGENRIKDYLKALFKLLIWPEDTISSTLIFRSPLLRLNDIDIDHVYTNNLWPPEINHKKRNNPEKEPLAQILIDFHLSLQTGAEILYNKDIFSTLRHLTNTFNLVDLARKIDGEIDFSEPLYRAFQIALSVDKIRGVTLEQRVQYFIEQLSSLSEMSDIRESESGANSTNGVQLMTFHKSKGLEFDYLFLADLFRTPNSDLRTTIFEHNLPGDPDNILYSVKGDLLHHSSGGETPQNFVERKRIEEMTRLLYVGMTRAKKRLYLSWPMESTGKKSYSGFLQDTCSSLSIHPPPGNGNQDAATGDQWIPVSGFSKTSIFFKHYKPDSTIEKESIQKIPAGSPPLASNSVFYPPRFFYSGTSLLKEGQTQPIIKPNNTDQAAELFEQDESITVKKEEIEYEQKSEPGSSTPARNTIEHPVTRGIILHSVFEWIDLKNPLWDKRWSKRLLLQHMIPETYSAQLDQLIEHTLATYKNSLLYETINGASIIGKEIPFSSYRLEGSPEFGIAVGYIDLIIEHDNEIEIIDYKSNRQTIPDEKQFNDQLLEKYSVPMELYRQAISQTFTEKKITLSLYHLPTGNLLRYPDK